MKALWQIFWFLRFIKGKLANTTVPWSVDAIVREYGNRNINALHIFTLAEKKGYIEHYGETRATGKLYIMTSKGIKLISDPIGMLQCIGDELGTGLSYVIAILIAIIPNLHHIMHFIKHKL